MFELTTDRQNLEWRHGERPTLGGGTEVGRVSLKRILAVGVLVASLIVSCDGVKVVLNSTIAIIFC